MKVKTPSQIVQLLYETMKASDITVHPDLHHVIATSAKEIHAGLTEQIQKGSLLDINSKACKLCTFWHLDHLQCLDDEPDKPDIVHMIQEIKSMIEVSIEMETLMGRNGDADSEQRWTRISNCLAGVHTALVSLHDGREPLIPAYVTLSAARRQLHELINPQSKGNQS